MKALRIKYLRNEIARIRSLIARGKDYNGALTNKANGLLCELDQLTQLEPTMKKRIITLIVLAALALTAATIASPCQTEDSRNCTWYADVQGNGQGTSFVDIAGMVIYLK